MSFWIEAERRIAIAIFAAGGVLLGCEGGDFLLGTDFLSRQNTEMSKKDDLLQRKSSEIRRVFNTMEKRLPRDSKMKLKITHDRAARLEFDMLLNDLVPTKASMQDKHDFISNTLGRKWGAWSLPHGNLWGDCIISISADHKRLNLPEGEREDIATLAITVAHEMAHCRASQYGFDSFTVQEGETFADIRGALVVGATWRGWTKEATRYQLSVRLAQYPGLEQTGTHNTIEGLTRLNRFLNDDSYTRKIAIGALGVDFGNQSVEKWLSSATSNEIDAVAFLLTKGIPEA